MDTHSIGRARVGITAALSSIRKLHNAKYTELNSDYDHDAFLIDNTELISVSSQYLSEKLVIT